MDISSIEFEHIVNFGRGFKGLAGTELAFVLSEFTIGGGPIVSTAYPSTRNTLDPEGALPESRAALWAGKRGPEWESVLPVLQAAGFNTFGQRRQNMLIGGVGNTMSIKNWSAKGIGAFYIIATESTLDQINADALADPTTAPAVALIRTYINSDENNHQLAPTEPFTVGQVSVLSSWLNAGSVNREVVTNSEFAALFNIQAAQLANWLQTNPRWKLAKAIYDNFV